MYNYQMETLQQLEETAEKLEGKTQEKYKLLIGEYSMAYYHPTVQHYVTETGNLYLSINTGANKFKIIDELTDKPEYLSITQMINHEMKIKINKNVFLQLNKLIDKIIKDNKERERFHYNLNQELKAINNSL